MSAEAVGFTWRHSPYRGVMFTIHLAVADVANDVHEYELWIRARVLAAKARTSRKAVYEALDTLCRDGFLTRLDPPGEATGAPVRYRFEMPEAPIVFAFGGVGAAPIGGTSGVTRVARQVSPGDTPGVTPIKEGTQVNSKNQRPRREQLAEAQRACPSEGRALVERLVELVVANGSRTPTPTASWYDEARRLLTIDKVRFEDALAVLEWSQADDFWSSNILSMPKFRAKYDAVRLKMRRAKHPAGSRRGEAASEDEIVAHIEDARKRKAAR